MQCTINVIALYLRAMKWMLMLNLHYHLVLYPWSLETRQQRALLFYCLDSLGLKCMLKYPVHLPKYNFQKYWKSSLDFKIFVMIVNIWKIELGSWLAIVSYRHQEQLSCGCHLDAWYTYTQTDFSSQMNKFLAARKSFDFIVFFRWSVVIIWL